MSRRQTIPLPRLDRANRRATRPSRQDRRLRGGLRQGGALEHFLGLQGGRLLRAPRVVGRARVACAPHGLLLIREVARRLRGPQRGQRGRLVLLRRFHDPAAARQLVDGRLPRLQVRGLAALRGRDHEVGHAGAVVEHRVVHRDHAGAVVASMPPTAVVEDRHVPTGAIGGEQVANLVEARHSHSDDALSARNTKKHTGQ
mmetsp:Transcript_71088/g.185099  ORF Transcript_71088/g.185099 Transcript_71088/m.185099 type:complete len:200 (+) Transcript_71088:97-696(+)